MKTLSLAAMLLPLALQAQTFTVSVKNPGSSPRADVPVVVNLTDVVTADDLWLVQSASVNDQQTEVPSQLDDLNQDGRFDELAFVTDLKGKQTKTFTVTLSQEERALPYPARTFAELMLRNPKVKQKNKHDIYLTDLFFSPETKDPFHTAHHHGVAMESELVALRIYFDHRQTPDLYGKFNKGLEIRDTQFYPSTEQLQQGYGDDVLWVGNTFGFGAFRGWNGKQPSMLSDVRARGQRIIATGPVRTITELVDRGWKPEGTEVRTTTIVRYTLWAGHRDFQVDVFFDRDLSKADATRSLRFSTGLINMNGSTEIADQDGLRGFWGTAWPVALKDSAGHKPETVGMGIYVPKTYREQTLPADKDNYGYVLRPEGDHIRYYITYTSDNESFGYHSLKDWTAYLKEWRTELTKPVVVTAAE